MTRHLVTPLFLTAIALGASAASAQRAIGIDVSYWQGPSINWATVAKPIAQGGGGIQFAFVRSSRGGTTGTSTHAGGTNSGTLSQRYDDPYFVSNMTGATNNGILAGAYHYARPDIATNTGLDEANHFIEQAGNYMKPGYLRPVLDLEAGDQRSTTDLTNWALEFSDRILAVTGIRPIVYVNISYANQVDSRINIHDLWLARYFSSTTTPGPYDPSVQEAIDPPAAGSLNTYGAWAPGGTYPTPRPWDFWQYGATGSTPGVPGNNDRNVANGDIEFVKDFLVPAIWFVNADGQWTTASNWNSGTYLPAAKDRVIINRTAGNYQVTLASGTHSVRSLQLNERLNMTGGSLSIQQYANLANTVSISSGTFAAGNIVNTSTLTQSGGTINTGAITGGGTIQSNGGTLNASSLRQNTLNLNGGTVRLSSTTVTSSVKSLPLATTGKLDIGNSRFVVDYTGSSVLESVRLMTLSAYNGGAWDGPGITSSTLSPATGVGYAEANVALGLGGGFYGDLVVDGTAILIKRALKGDTNLNGTVDFTDLLALAQSYGVAGKWQDGDVNYDGQINFTDLLGLAQNYGATLLTDGTIVAGDDAMASNFAADWALAQSMVPEPTALAAIALLTPRRRRR